MKLLAALIKHYRISAIQKRLLKQGFNKGSALRAARNELKA